MEHYHWMLTMAALFFLGADAQELKGDNRHAKTSRWFAIAATVMAVAEMVLRIFAK